MIAALPPPVGWKLMAVATPGLEARSLAFPMIVWELTTNLPFALPGVKLPHLRAIAAQLHAAPAATVVLAGV